MSCHSTTTFLRCIQTNGCGTTNWNCRCLDILYHNSCRSKNSYQHLVLPLTCCTFVLAWRAPSPEFCFLILASESYPSFEWLLRFFKSPELPSAVLDFYKSRAWACAIGPVWVSSLWYRGFDPLLRLFLPSDLRSFSRGSRSLSKACRTS